MSQQHFGPGEGLSGPALIVNPHLLNISFCFTVRTADQRVSFMATTHSVGSGDYIRPYRNVRIKHFPVTVSQTILRGDAVKLAGAGLEQRIKIGVVSETTGYVGIAAEDITTTATHDAVKDRIAVWLATEDAEFIGRTVSDDTVDFSDIGVGVALDIDSDNSIWVVETDDVTAEIVRVLEYLDPTTKNVQTAEGDTSALCVFKFLPGATIWGQGIVQA